ncbi:MAG: polysaccharide deacetylase family protein [Anaerobacillus sp.]
MYKIKWMILSLFLISGCQTNSASSLPLSHDKSIVRSIPSTSAPFNNHIEQVITAFENQHPTDWGENVPGVKTRFETNQKEVALTFDACGGQHGSDVDDDLLTYLIEHDIPSTLFMNGRWIDENTSLFRKLAANPLFEIENHGSNHRPLSVNGKSAWGIQGTTSVEEVIDEMKVNQDKIFDLTGKEPALFRSGTAYYDDVAVKIGKRLGIQFVNYTILGDAGATYTSDQVKQALLDAKPGDIALLHMNQPTSGTAEGVIQAIPTLKQRGYSFVQLHDQNLH